MNFRNSRTTKKIIVFAVVFVMILIAGRVSGSDKQVVEVSAIKDDYSVQDNRQQFLKSLGWEVDPQFTEVEEITIPSEFNLVYENYNNLQKQQGYNLQKYRGKKVTRYTYKILNYQDETLEVRVNILVYKGKVIGGDVCSLELDGFMQGLKL